LGTSGSPASRLPTPESYIVRVRHEVVAETVVLFCKGGDNTCCSASSPLPRRASLATGRCGPLGTTNPHPPGWQRERAPRLRLPAPKWLGTTARFCGLPTASAFGVDLESVVTDVDLPGL